MSRHHVHTTLGSRRVVVVAGYDRPTGELFLQLLSDNDDEPEEEGLLYSSLEQPHRNWHCLDTLSEVATELGLVLPTGMLDAVHGDQVSKAGNRIVVHHFDQPPEVLLAG